MKRSIIKRRLVSAWLWLLLPVSGALFFLTGCGEKIAIPVAEGLTGNYSFTIFAEYQFDQPVVDLKVSLGRVYVLQADTLRKYPSTLNDSLAVVVTGMTDARAMTLDENVRLLFVWDEATKIVTWYLASSLAYVGQQELPDVQSVVAMGTNNSGIEQLPGIRTYLYLSDPEALVVHRYGFDEIDGLIPYGILTRADGDAARFVHIPSAMLSDIDNKFLVCDQDTNRNWVIRFDSTPDLTDTSNDPLVDDELRGTAFPFFDSGCAAPPAGDFVLGYAAECGQVGWEGKPSDLNGEFHVPAGLAMDGQGRIFVADYLNNRVQLFDSLGDYDRKIGTEIDTPGPTAIGVYDIADGSNAEDVQYAAFVYVLVPELNRIVRYISKEYEANNREEIPPPLD